MKKKLNLVLRNPVKLHETNLAAPELPSPFGKREVAEKEPEKLEHSPELVLLEAKKEKTVSKKVREKTSPDRTEKLAAGGNAEDLRNEMSLRIKQIWEYFCLKANEDNELKNSFTVTRAEVMNRAGIGSTNTYRDALKKMQNLGLIRIELRPGVNQGSVFYLTDQGLEQAKLVLSEK